MFEKVDPDGDEFEALKQFCFRIGEGRLEPKVIEIHYFMLYHPTVVGAYLVVYWDAMDKHFYIREEHEGSTFNFDELPLVHSFPLQDRGRPRRSIFPYAVDIGKDEVIYYYEQEQVEGATVIERVAIDRYFRLLFLFDEKNPIPWKEQTIRMKYFNEITPDPEIYCILTFGVHNEGDLLCHHIWERTKDEPEYGHWECTQCDAKCGVDVWD